MEIQQAAEFTKKVQLLKIHKEENKQNSMLQYNLGLLTF